MTGGVPCHPERSEGSVSLGVEMLRCAQHDSAVLLPRPHHLRAFRLLSPPQHLMGFSWVDAYWATLVVALFPLVRPQERTAIKAYGETDRENKQAE